MLSIVDTASIYYESSSLDISTVIERVKYLTKKEIKLENNKYVLKDFKINKLEHINMIIITQLKKNVRITIGFSYSRYENKNNYELAAKQETIKRVHNSLVSIFRLLTDKTIILDDLRIYTIDISNQLEVPNVKGYYNVLDLIYKSIKKQEPNGRLYFDTDKDSRKELDGLDFRERGKKRRESSTYFKIYSKRKELEDTGKDPKGKATALRGELTLKGSLLKKYNLVTPNAITKANIEKVLKKNLCNLIMSGINEELNENLNTLKTICIKNKTKNLRQTILLHEYLIFDIELLNILVIPEVLGVQERMCRIHKAAIIELLKEAEKKSEIKKTYEGNFKKLKKLLKKIIKTDITVNLTKEGVKIEWQ